MNPETVQNAVELSGMAVGCLIAAVVIVRLIRTMVDEDGRKARGGGSGLDMREE